MSKVGTKPFLLAICVMPVNVTCQCGRRFAAPDELMGRRVRCPSCQSPLDVPRDEELALQPDEVAVPPPVSSPEPAPQTVESPKFSELLDEEGVGRRSEPSSQRAAYICPGCGGPFNAGSVLCVHCGYHLRKQRKLATKKSVDERKRVKAAKRRRRLKRRSAEASSSEESSRREIETLDWSPLIWSPLALLAASVAGGFLLADYSAFIWQASLGLCMLIGTYAWVMYLFAGFGIGLVHGLVMLVLPFYTFAFTGMYWEESKPAFRMLLISLLCTLATLLGSIVVPVIPTDL